MHALCSIAGTSRCHDAEIDIDVPNQSGDLISGFHQPVTPGSMRIGFSQNNVVRGKRMQKIKPNSEFIRKNRNQ
jgi:hypothetical protein